MRMIVNRANTMMICETDFNGTTKITVGVIYR
jgi:hypothetical protein